MRLLALLLSLTSVAVAEEPRPEARAWVERVRDHYRYFDSIEPVPQKTAWASQIDLRCGARRVRTMRVEPWGAALRLKRHDDGLFFTSMELSVRRLTDPHEDAAASYWAVGGEACLAATYAFEAIIQAGPYLVSLRASCEQSRALFVHEVADLIGLVRASGERVADRLVYDVCGQAGLGITRVESVIADAAKSHRLRKHALPADRDAAKARAGTP